MHEKITELLLCYRAKNSKPRYSIQKFYSRSDFMNSRMFPFRSQAPYKKIRTGSSTSSRTGVSPLIIRASHRSVVLRLFTSTLDHNTLPLPTGTTSSFVGNHKPIAIFIYILDLNSASNISIIRSYQYDISFNKPFRIGLLVLTLARP